MDKAKVLYGDALHLLDVAAKTTDPAQRAMLLKVAVCIRDHARDVFSRPSDAWPPELVAEPSEG